jgi:S1-C subfamily serine protease
MSFFHSINRIVYLKKGNRFNNVDLQDKSGIHIVRTVNRPVVDSVDPGSPAALAGVLPGDEILRLDDIDAGQLTLFSVRKLLCRPGLSVRLTLRRRASEVALPLALSN